MFGSLAFAILDCSVATVLTCGLNFSYKEHDDANASSSTACNSKPLEATACDRISADCVCALCILRGQNSMPSRLHNGKFQRGR